MCVCMYVCVFVCVYNNNNEIIQTCSCVLGVRWGVARVFVWVLWVGQIFDAFVCRCVVCRCVVCRCVVCMQVCVIILITKLYKRVCMLGEGEGGCVCLSGFYGREVRYSMFDAKSTAKGPIWAKSSVAPTVTSNWDSLFMVFQLLDLRQSMVFHC